MSALSAPRVVVKVGGDILLNAAERDGLCRNIVGLVARGARVCVLHGGGPQVNVLQEAVGLTPKKVGGRRVTSLDDLRVVHQAICGEVSVALTSALRAAKVRALGIDGAAAGLFQARKRPPTVVAGGGETPIDFGEVGDVAHVETAVIEDLWSRDFVPVIATLAGGMGEEAARTFNINADDTSVDLAIALKATALLMVTEVGAVFGDLKDPTTRVAEIDAEQARGLIRDGIIVDGMIPKVERALSALDHGVDRVAIVGAKHPGAFVAIALDDGAPDFGTRICRE